MCKKCLLPIAILWYQYAACMSSIATKPENKFTWKNYKQKKDNLGYLHPSASCLMRPSLGMAVQDYLKARAGGGGWALPSLA